MKPFKHIHIVFNIVLVLVGALQTTLARNLYASEKYYLSPMEIILSVSITCPPPVTVTCTNQVPPANFAFGVATSTCPGTVTVVHLGDVISNQICPNIYIITRTYEATDVCLNTATCTQIITVHDNIPPVITCPSGITINCASQVPPPNIGTVLAIDCGTTVITHLGDVISNLICPSQYTITRTYRATDVCGNSSTCTQLISVFDNTPPIITCPPSMTISCSDNSSPSSTGMATSADNCGQSAVMTFSDNYIPGSCPNSGNIQRTFMAVDNCGNSSTCVQIISLEDMDPPIIICPPSITISCSDDSSPLNTGIATSFDNCDPNPPMNFSDNYIPGSCTNSGIIQHIFTTIDDCGNSSTCIQIISVVDNIPPVISNGPVDITVTASGPSPCSMYVSIGIPTAIDDCAQNVLISNDYNSTADASDIYPEGSTLVTYTATDECGNTSTHTFMVVVMCQPTVPCGIVVHSDCNVEISGYTRLGDVSEGAPYIKMKELPSVTTGSNNNSSVSIPHGLVASKIISVSVLVESGVNQFTPPEYSSAINLRYSFSVTPTDIVIQNNTMPGDCVICSKTAKVLIIYKD